MKLCFWKRLRRTALKQALPRMPSPELQREDSPPFLSAEFPPCGLLSFCLPPAYALAFCVVECFFPGREWKLILPSATALIMKLVGIATWKFPESLVILPSEPQPSAVCMVMRGWILSCTSLAFLLMIGIIHTHYRTFFQSQKREGKQKQIVSLHASRGTPMLASSIISSGHCFLTWLRTCYMDIAKPVCHFFSLTI